MPEYFDISDGEWHGVGHDSGGRSGLGALLAVVFSIALPLAFLAGLVVLTIMVCTAIVAMVRRFPKAAAAFAVLWLIGMVVDWRDRVELEAREHRAMQRALAPFHQERMIPVGRTSSDGRFRVDRLEFQDGRLLVYIDYQPSSIYRGCRQEEFDGAGGIGASRILARGAYFHLTDIPSTIVEFSGADSCHVTLAVKEQDLILYHDYHFEWIYSAQVPLFTLGDIADVCRDHPGSCR
jgi:hypothetical protein